MLKHLAVVAVLVATHSAASLAADVAADKDGCFKVTLDLAESAEEKQLAGDRRAKVENLLSEMENHCEASEFTQATTVSKDIEAAISGQ